MPPHPVTLSANCTLSPNYTAFHTTGINDDDQMPETFRIVIHIICIY